MNTCYPATFHLAALESLPPSSQRDGLMHLISASGKRRKSLLYSYLDEDVERVPKAIADALLGLLFTITEGDAAVIQRLAELVQGLEATQGVGLPSTLSRYIDDVFQLFRGKSSDPLIRVAIAHLRTIMMQPLSSSNRSTVVSESISVVGDWSSSGISVTLAKNASLLLKLAYGIVKLQNARADWDACNKLYENVLQRRDLPYDVTVIAGVMIWRFIPIEDYDAVLVRVVPGIGVRIASISHAENWSPLETPFQSISVVRGYLVETQDSSIYEAILEYITHQLVESVLHERLRFLCLEVLILLTGKESLRIQMRERLERLVIMCAKEKSQLLRSKSATLLEAWMRLCTSEECMLKAFAERLMELDCPPDIKFTLLNKLAPALESSDQLRNFVLRTFSDSKDAELLPKLSTLLATLLNSWEGMESLSHQLIRTILGRLKASEDDFKRRNLATCLLRPLLIAYPHRISSIMKSLDGVDSPTVHTALLVASIARSIDVNGLELVPKRTLRAALEADLASEILTLLCDSPRAASSIGPYEVDMLKKVVVLHMDTTSNAYREKFGVQVRKLLRRTRNYLYALRRQGKSGLAEIHRIGDLLRWMVESSSRHMYSRCQTFSRPYLALTLLLSVLEEIGTGDERAPSPPPEGFSEKHGVRPSLPFQVPYPESLLPRLGYQLDSPFDEHRVLAYRCLRILVTRAGQLAGWDEMKVRLLSPQSSLAESGALRASLFHRVVKDKEAFENRLYGLFKEALDAGELDLMEATKRYPLHGVLQAFGLCNPKPSMASDVVEPVFNLITPILSHSSPEGNLPTIVDQQPLPDLPLDSSATQSQFVLSYAWRAALQAAALLRKSMIPVKEHVCKCAAIFKSALLTFRHRGAFSTVYPEFSKFCRALLDDAPYSEFAALPRQWLEEVLSSLMLTPETRRSAGLPHTVLALAVADPSAGSISHIVSRLHDIVNKDTLVKINSLNILRALHEERQLAKVMSAHLQEGLLVSLANLNDPLWGIRNAALMLYSTLVDRVMAPRNAKNGLTITEFSNRFPKVSAYLLKGASPLATFVLLSRLQQPVTNLDMRMIKFCRHALETHKCSAVRTMAATAFSKLVPECKIQEMAEDLLGQPKGPLNAWHGRLVALSALIERGAQVDQQHIARVIALLPPGLRNEWSSILKQQVPPTCFDIESFVKGDYSFKVASLRALLSSRELMSNVNHRSLQLILLDIVTSCVESDDLTTLACHVLKELPESPDTRLIHLLQEDGKRWVEGGWQGWEGRRGPWLRSLIMSALHRPPVSLLRRYSREDMPVVLRLAVCRVAQGLPRDDMAAILADLVQDDDPAVRQLARKSVASALMHSDIQPCTAIALESVFMALDAGQVRDRMISVLGECREINLAQKEGREHQVLFLKEETNQFREPLLELQVCWKVLRRKADANDDKNTKRLDMKELERDMLEVLAGSRTSHEGTSAIAFASPLLPDHDNV